MARSTRLKVYRARMGFFEAVVAAPSQKAALEAWGTRQDLFAEGLAEVTDEADAAQAALAHPGVVLQRPIGGRGAFEPPSSSATLPEPPPPRPKPPSGSGKAAAAPPPPDRGELTAAEATLAKLDREQTSELEALEAQRAAIQQQLKTLDARELDLRRGFEARRRELQRALERARKAFERAGGRP